MTPALHFIQQALIFSISLLYCVDCSCPPNVKLSSLQGRILSPNYPQPYSTNLLCNWTISLHPDQTIAFYISDLDLPPPPSASMPCNQDYLTFSEAGTDKITECGSMKNSAFTSYGNEILVQFHTDNRTTPHTGFNISYTAFGCVGINEDTDLYGVQYDFNDKGDTVVHIQCTNGKELKSTCEVYQWKPPLENIETYCTPQAPTTAKTKTTRVRPSILTSTLASTLGTTKPVKKTKQSVTVFPAPVQSVTHSSCSHSVFNFALMFGSFSSVSWLSRNFSNL